MPVPVCIISTVGQSVFQNASEHVREQSRQFGREQIDGLDGILSKKDFPGKELYEATMGILQACQDQVSLRRASAELNSLDRILSNYERNNNDQLHFLASETPDGVLAARVMADFCKTRFERETKAHLIEGLQVSDGNRFRQYGLRNLINKLYDILKEVPEGTYTRVLNPTGGFKGVVPYLTVVGMIEPKIEVSYVYERSPELITLAGLPLSLDFELLEEAYTALEACSHEDLVSEQALLEKLDLKGHPLSHHPAWSLFELLEDEKGRFYALSGLGQIAYRNLSKGRDLAAVYLSRQAATAYDKLDNTRQQTFAKLIDQIRQSEWRKKKQHGKKGDTLIFKQPHADERILYFWDQDDNAVLVAELVGHKDAAYSGPNTLRRKDYDKFRKWEGK